MVLCKREGKGKRREGSINMYIMIAIIIGSFLGYHGLFLIMFSFSMFSSSPADGSNVSVGLATRRR